MAATARLLCNAPDPWEFAKTVGKSQDIGVFLGALDDYFEACGVEHFTAFEVCTMSSSSQDVAKRMKADKSMHRGQYVEPLPIWLWQPMAALLVGFCDPIRKALGAPVTFRNGLRQWAVNQQVASSGIMSDHPNTACADLDLSRDGDLDAAHRTARALYDLHGTTQGVSLGQGDTVIHIGIHSPMGHRKWTY